MDGGVDRTVGDVEMVTACASSTSASTTTPSALCAPARMPDEQPWSIVTLCPRCGTEWCVVLPFYVEGWEAGTDEWEATVAPPAALSDHQHAITMGEGGVHVIMKRGLD